MRLMKRYAIRVGNLLLNVEALDKLYSGSEFRNDLQVVGKKSMC